MLAKKENREYTINETEKKRYLERGFDIVDDNGKLIETSPSKTISYSEHIKKMEALKRENETLMAELDKANEVPKNAKDLKNKVEELTVENDTLKVENKALKEANETLNNQILNEVGNND